MTTKSKQPELNEHAKLLFSRFDKILKVIDDAIEYNHDSEIEDKDMWNYISNDFQLRRHSIKCGSMM